MTLFEILNKYLLFTIGGVASVLAIVYIEPESQTQLFIGLVGFSPQTLYDYPSAWVFLFVLLLIVLIIDNFGITEKAYHSDSVWCAGLNYCPSCVASTLMIVGEWGFIRTEAIKRFASDMLGGNYVLCNFSSHIHRVGNTIIFEGHAIPQTPLSHIPAPIKSDVRQKRGGLLGASTCGVGYLSDQELVNHKEFVADVPEISDYLEQGEHGKVIQTQEFIESIRDANRDLNMMVEFNAGERESLVMFLNNVVKIGNSIRNVQDQSVLDRIFGGKS